MKRQLMISMSIIIVLLSSILNAGEVYIGIEPSFVKEPFYVEGEYDINLLPLVVEAEISDDFSLRLVTLMTYHFGGTEGFYDKGIEVALPYYLGDKNLEGFYIAPIVNLVRNDLSLYKSTTLAGEIGYAFLFDDGFSLIAGFQYGETTFYYDSGSIDPVEHMGLKVRLGYCLD